MASEIKVDTIVNAGGDNDTGIDLATNDQILLKVANATRLTMNATGQTTIVGEGGTTTTNLQQGLAKLWLNVENNGTNNDSLNVSSHADTAAGRQTISITSAFRATATMSGAACASETDASNGSENSNRYALFIRGDTTTEAFLNTGVCSSGGLEDTNISSGVMCGDLA